MSKVRLWTLGKLDGTNPENWIIPTKTYIDRFKQELRDAKAIDASSSEPSPRIIDLVCGPDVKCTIIDELPNKVLVPVKQEDGTFLYKLEDV
jgi:hypothetical protein